MLPPLLSPTVDARFAGLPNSGVSFTFAWPSGAAHTFDATVMLPPVDEPSKTNGVVGVELLLLFNSCLRCWFFSIFSNARIMACILRSSRVSFLLSLIEFMATGVVVDVVGLVSVGAVVVVDVSGIVVICVAEVSGMKSLLDVSGVSVDSKEHGVAVIC